MQQHHKKSISLWGEARNYSGEEGRRPEKSPLGSEKRAPRKTGVNDREMNSPRSSAV